MNIFNTKPISKVLGIRDIGSIDVTLFDPKKDCGGILNAHYGKTQTDNQRKAMSDYMRRPEIANKKNRFKHLNQVLKTCFKCGIQIKNHGVFSRWHGDRCKGFTKYPRVREFTYGRTI